MYSRLHLSTLSNMEPVHLDEFYAKNKQPGPDFKTFGEEHIQMLLKVCARFSCDPHHCAASCCLETSTLDACYYKFRLLQAGLLKTCVVCLFVC